MAELVVLSVVVFLVALGLVSLWPQSRRVLSVGGLVFAFIGAFILARLFRFGRGLLRVVIYPTIVAFARVAPRLGAHTGDVAGRFVARVESRMGDDLLAFRNLLRDIYLEYGGLPNDNRPNPTLREEIHASFQTVERRHRNGEFLISVGGGILSVGLTALSGLAPLAFVFGTLLVLLLLAIVLRIGIVDVLMYDSHDAAGARRQELWFMWGWNRMIQQNDANISKLVLVGVLRGENAHAVDHGHEVIRTVLSGEGDLVDGLENIVTQVYGEEAFVPERLKRASRRRLYDRP